MWRKVRNFSLTMTFFHLAVSQKVKKPFEINARLFTYSVTRQVKGKCW